VSSNYFFVSSPLHLLFACNLALVHADDDNSVVLVPRSSQPFSAFAEVLENQSAIFDQIISFETGLQKSQHAERKRRMKVIREALQLRSAERIFTGTDRRVEFQYAMYIATRLNPGVKGIYLDDGMATYLGHKSMNNLAHNYIDPYVKKLIYGRWWDNPVTIGSSHWIDEIHVAYPALIHESLKHKKVVAVDRAVFKHPRFTALCEKLLQHRHIDPTSLGDIDATIVLTHESFYPDPENHLHRLIQAIKTHRPASRIAIKPHPRSEQVQRYRLLFPDMLFLDSQVGMELFLPLLKDDCVIVGDISSVMFTTRWISEKTRVMAVTLPTTTLGHLQDNLFHLFDRLGITRVSIEQLASALKQAN